MRHEPESLSLTRLILLAGALAALLRGTARAEPYLMVREGAKCNACHTNQTGGGKRTAFAHIHSHDIEHDLDLLPIPKGLKAFNGEINQYISIGGDLRVRNTSIFEDHPDAHGNVSENQAFRGHLKSNDTAVNLALLYLQVDLWPDIATFYVDESVNGGATNREVFGMIHGLPWDTYIKAGRLFPAYGLRVQDDQAFIRSETGYTFQTSDAGGEVGFGPGPFFLAASVTNGVGGDRDVATSLNGYGLFEDVPVVRTILAGASFARQTNRRDVYGVYAGSNIATLTYLAEFDVIDDRQLTSPTRRDQYTSYLEADWLTFDWLNLRGTFEFLKIAGDRDRTRYTIGAEPFINKYLQPRIQYRINNAPGHQPTLNQNELWLEFHMFF
jgi:hypothetical protein